MGLNSKLYFRSQVPQKGFIPFNHHTWGQSFFNIIYEIITKKFSLKFSTTPPRWIKNFKIKKKKEKRKKKVILHDCEACL
jgi:hypothetical protein